KYFKPTLEKDEFHCPHCNVYSKQLFARVAASHITNISDSQYNFTSFSETLASNWRITKCVHCHNYILWQNRNIIFPKSIIVESPNEDLNTDIIKDYIEAGIIFNDSPRAAAALLRL